jgi:hypothetical protein
VPLVLARRGAATGHICSLLVDSMLNAPWNGFP